MIDNRTVGKTIAALRQARGMTQQQLAAAMNVSHQAVSKWENGAALPDIQTLVELTHLFGVTVEQLLNGEIPQERMENTSTLDEHLHNIGNFVGGMINDIGNVFKSEPKKPCEQESENKTVNENADNTEKVDIEHLLEMAPFMSKSALEDMIRRSGKKLSPAEISKFAPFVSTTFLEEMICDGEQEINWDSLRKIAPFLKKEAVDAFARMIATGERVVRPASAEASRTAEDVRRTLDDVSHKISRGVDKAVRKAIRIGENVANEVSKAFDGMTVEMNSRESRQAQLRRSAFERALEEQRWDWIEAHIRDLTDEDLLCRIAAKANEIGMQDWVCRNIGEYAEETAVEAAIDRGDWDWLSGYAWKFSESLQRRVAMAAAGLEKWDWLEKCAEQMKLSDCAPELVAAARAAGKTELAAALVRNNMQPEQIEHLAAELAGGEDEEFFGRVLVSMNPERVLGCCDRLCRGGDWMKIRRLEAALEEESIEMLMETAIEMGNFDAYDMLEEMLSAKETEASV